MYLSLLLPLAVGSTYTYLLPTELADKVSVGTRVIAQFGPKRYYTAIVVAMLNDNPCTGVKLKAISDVIDPTPIILPSQLKLWQWIAQYYMCTMGEVMKAALPTGLKLESETTLMRNAEFDAEANNIELSERERAILEALDDDKGKNLIDIEKALGLHNIMRPIKRLMELEAIIVRESIAHTYKPRKAAYVRLTPVFQSEASLHQALNSLTRATAQAKLLVRYLDLSKAITAITLHHAQPQQPVTRQD